MCNMLKCIIIFTIFIGATMIANSQTKQLPTRAEIDDKYKWNIADIFATEADWENEFQRISKEYGQITQFNGKLGTSSKIIFDCLKFSNDIWASFSRVYLYVSLARDTDLNEGKYQVMFDRVQKLSSEISAASSFINPELIAIPKEQFNIMLKEPILKEYKHLLESIYSMRDHTLPAEQEKLLATLVPIFQTANNTYSILNDAELPFPKIKLDDGSDMQVSHGRY